jgi:hypothetical protein
MNPDKIDRAFAIAANVAYLLVVLAFLVVLFPGLRQWARQLTQALIWNYQLGTYLRRKGPVPGYVVDALAGKVADVDEHGAPSPEA